MTPDKITLISNGYRFENFQTISASASLDNMARTFDISMYATNNWKEALDLNDIKIYIGDELFLNGLVDNLEYSIDDTNKVTLSGRSKVSNIIDSSYIGKSQFKNIEVQELLSTILSPYDIEVSFNITTPYTFKTFEIDSGEELLSILGRISQQAQLVYNENPNGSLGVFQEINHSNYSLSLQHIKTRKYLVDNTVLNSIVYVRGQGEGVGLKNNNIEAAATNNIVTTFRPLVITHQSITKESASALAKWKVSKQIGQSVRLSYSVVLDRNIPLGYEIMIDDDLLDISGKFVINSVKHTQDADSGSVSNITLVLPESFIKQPVIKEIKVNKSKKAKGTKLITKYNADGSSYQVVQ